MPVSRWWGGGGTLPYPSDSTAKRPVVDEIPFLAQKVAWGTAVREWDVQVQLINPVHQLYIGATDRMRRVLTAAPACLQQHRLAQNARHVISIRHFFALLN